MCLNELSKILFILPALNSKYAVMIPKTTKRVMVSLLEPLSVQFVGTFCLVLSIILIHFYAFEDV